MNFYLKRFGFQTPQIKEAPETDLELIVVIPCFNEPDLIASLESLYNCDHPEGTIEIIVVINSGIHHSNAIKLENQKTLKTVNAWIDEKHHKKIKSYTISEADLPKKHAGVGLARKIGMDEAVSRFDSLNKDGLIVCFDADSLCQKNYLVEIEKHFKANKKTPGCSIHYEHPIDGNTYPKEIYQGIINYELHLRYYNLALMYCKLPYAFHTVGSSMAVRSSAYQKQGGMNKRKAGEDFYFIHKIIALGNYTTIKSTKVIPSPRISDRVPFGTGKAIGDWIDQGEEIYQTYNFESFEIIRAFIIHAHALQSQKITEIPYQLSSVQKTRLFDFLEQNKFNLALNEIRKNSTNPASFLKRFYTWFDAFKVLKLMHFLRDNGIQNDKLTTQVERLLRKNGRENIPQDPVNQLILLREIEKN